MQITLFKSLFYGLASNNDSVLEVHCGASDIPDSLEKDLCIFRLNLDMHMNIQSVLSGVPKIIRSPNMTASKTISGTYKYLYSHSGFRNLPRNSPGHFAELVLYIKEHVSLFFLCIRMLIRLRFHRTVKLAPHSTWHSFPKLTQVLMWPPKHWLLLEIKHAIERN